ncbi:hypothetical protein BVRB_001860 [Beta vulgaris subsp. vulgaris]|uniref:Uncharacterized protein n=1 Tax=Beta vulgaris subsp. vulgaris TaxID=3555 RepID=A0A0J8B835_BETVV|nr:hypothetical protein BVRB_001860 [Beta vulgaris subsp. vulgaris]
MSHDQQVSTIKKRTRDDNDDEMELIAVVSGFIMVAVGACHNRFKHKDMPWIEHERAMKRAYWLDSLMNDRICKEQLRMDRSCFDKLCHVLVAKGGLVTTRNVTVLEIVAFFLHTLAHDLKNRTIGDVFTRSGETVSRQFHTVLKVVMKIGKLYIKQVDSSVTYDGDNKWKWFEGALGALDGTLIKITVRVEDRPRYRDRKGDITTNVLATCDPSLRFNYVLPGWEGSTSDPRILGDALQRPNGLKVPKNKYLLVDLGYSNAQGFLAPYKGSCYHLNLWRGTTPTNYKELFNLRHSSARNTIERAFGLLKKRWAILRKSSFYEKQTQDNKNAASYRNKCIENWDDICTLFGADRDVGDGSEQYDEAADAMEEEMISEGKSSSKDPTVSSSRKRKKDSVADAVNSFADSFREYVQSKMNDTPKPTCQEIYTVVSEVYGISRNQIMRAVKRFMNGNPDEFLMLKELPEDEKLDWVLLCLAE